VGVKYVTGLVDARPTVAGPLHAHGVTAGRGGRVIPLAGDGVLGVTFRQAQAHTSSGQPSMVSQPPAHLGYSRMVCWAPAGDFEGVLTYGIGIAWPVRHSNPQLAVRTTEVEKVTDHGQHRYIVAIDVDTSSASSQH
jgi:hypothetical protein